MELANSRRHPVGRLTLSVVLYVCVSRVWCSYTPPTQSPQDLRASSLVRTTDGCSDSCNTITEEMCGSFGVCSLSCRSGSRTTLPSRTVLTSTTECSGSQPGSLPAGVNGANGNYFTNSNDSTPCNVNTTVTIGSTSTFSISFWIQGSCTNCTVLGDGSSLTVKLRGNLLQVNTQTVSSSVTDTDFVHVVLTKRSSTMFDVYVNNTASTASVTTPNLQNTILVLGPETVLTGSESLLLLDGRFYNDGLTKREIKELFTGTFTSVSLESECRCPVSQPDISTDELMCSGGSGSNIRRLTKQFSGVNGVLGNSPSYNWVSKATGDVTIMFDLQSSFQVTEVTVTFSSNGSSPTRTEWSFESHDQKSRVDSSRYTLNSTQLHIKSATPPDYQAFGETIAEKIEMKITERSSGSVSNLIISSVTISGKCDCDGAASTCSLTSGSSASYTCMCLNQTEGDHCRSCDNGYYREETGFGCTQSCDCDADGRNATRHCETVGGQCLCKSNVAGARCDTCKPLTYNITKSNPEGCTRSSCDAGGSSACNNETGECYCRTNVVNSNCSECKDKHYWTPQTGCLPCLCDTKGTKEASGLVCDVGTGQCDCKQNVQDRQCGQCKDQFYDLSMNNAIGCSPCQCHTMGTSNTTCDKGSSGQCQCRGDDFTNRTCTPSVTDVVPLFGPVIGGTVVTITGHYLVNSTVTIGPTDLIATGSDTQLIIIIPAKGVVTSETLSVTWNSSSPLAYNFQYTYKPNPRLAAENPTSATAAQSGGCYVTLAGENLNSVYKPRMMVNASGEESYSYCEPESSGKRMKCATPAAVGLNGSVAPVYVLFDNYLGRQRLNLTLMQDAVVNTGLFLEFAPPFEKTITIMGERIGTDCLRRDYRVVIGDDVDCPITSFTETSIECEPPSSPPVTSTMDKRKYKMSLFIGAREVNVGEIYYKQFWLTKYFVYIMVGCGVFIIALITLLICICVCRRRRSRKKQMSEPLKNITPLTENNGRPVSDDHELIQPARTYTPFPRINQYTNRAFDGTDAEEHDKDEVVNTEYFLHRVEESIRTKVQACVIGKKNFNVGSVCSAKGNHARLVDGTFTARSKIEPMEKLTIKMLKNPLPDSGVLSSLYTTALRECLRFKPYDDESLLTIKGIGLDKRRFYILYPYMENRTLKDHVLDSKKDFVLRQLLELAGQVCEGMDFLSSKDVVHKDLATRNCMLDAAGRVKITDAAFSWDFYPNEYMYDSQRDRYLPVRWMAPESLSTGFYDSKSDVWSFGVLMWELMTRGLVPFQEIADENVQDAIVEGFRLGKPQMLSEDLYELMNSCWHAENEHRPSFVRIQQEISSAMSDRSSMNESLYVNQESIQNIYINSDEIQQIGNTKNNYR
ncbi:uncharacterized protein LOC124267286 [Haliotis rubra]|uniref:uncharacterized protein LOC124267286 n=1 Tax=Haliotis rubra TaxID=36100 RepID=UPI001EE59898|nr:uncharacterized protein LOC124267286 [Haliotis rubra]XP_046558159.1 uncharacterized protein LOC124267286 [Haliotis rubra]